MTKSEILFGSGFGAVNISRWAPVVGVSPSTLREWRKNPDKMPLWAVARMVRLRELTKEKRLEVLRDDTK